MRQGRSASDGPCYGQPTGGTVHLVNGRVDSVGSGVKLENQFMIKVSDVSFNHSGPEYRQYNAVDQL